MYKTHVVILSSLVGVTILSGAILSTPSASATSDSTIDQINITVPVSCSLSASGMNSHNTSLNNNAYDSAVGTTTATVYCNDSNGFAIYAIGYTDDTDGKTVLTSSSLGSTYDITTGVATSGNDSKWAMKLATPSSPTPTYPLTIQNSFDSFHIVPDAYTMVAKRASATDVGTGAEGSTFTTTYQIYVGPTQPAGTYIGKVKYVLVHPQNEIPTQPVDCTAGNICYNPNTATATGQMGQRTAGNNVSVTLFASNFKRDGYGFAGWNTAYDYSGTFYGPNQTITTPADTSTNGLSLYAVWVPSAGTMQNWNSCSSLTQAPTNGTATLTSVTALTDQRDGNTYAVARLADGKCWMIENLRLDNTPELSSTNTHNPSLPLTNVNDSNTTSNHLSPTSSLAYDAATAPEGWCNTSSSACIDQSRLRTDNTVLFNNNTSSSYSASSNVYSYGNYYNWYSATAGYGKYGSSYDSSYAAPGDICPAGWHLPTGNTNGEYYNLNYAINNNNNTTDSTASQKIRNYPNNFVYSGRVNSSSFYSRNSGGAYWSASGANSSDAYDLYFGSTYVYPDISYDNKSHGEMVRCVAGV